MTKLKKISKQQYLELGKLGLPILATYDSQKNKTEWILYRLTNDISQEQERHWYKHNATINANYSFFTLVDDDCVETITPE